MKPSSALYAAFVTLALSLSLPGFSISASSPLPRSEPTELPDMRGSVRGTVTLPSSPPPYPMALIIAGSAPTDRDGNASALGLRTNALSMLGVCGLWLPGKTWHRRLEQRHPDVVAFQEDWRRMARQLAVGGEDQDVGH